MHRTVQDFEFLCRILQRYKSTPCCTHSSIFMETCTLGDNYFKLETISKAQSAIFLGVTAPSLKHSCHNMFVQLLAFTGYDLD